MSARQLSEYLATASTRPVLIDVREPWEYHTCHIQHTQLIPMRQIPTAMNELDPDQETVIICHHGIRSRSVAAYLAQNDFSNIINLSGGIDEWAKTVDHTMPLY
ncbi:MAG: sulfurtransferase [Candidatus Thioglobus sp.]|nr:MAG: sulfurtransferase [Candidatus Thioglobus sp.]|tara:strand:- start:69 stop:380 length:312 start_codon:yes stop_codon:yes gene_type:complete